MRTFGRSVFLHCSKAASVTSRTAVYGPVRTVVWQGSAGDCRPYADQPALCEASHNIGQMHMYLNYARENWMKPGENPPVGLILCAEKGAAEAHYALDNLPNKVLATEYQTVLPDEKLIAQELERSREHLEKRHVELKRKILSSEAS